MAANFRCIRNTGATTTCTKSLLCMKNTRPIDGRQHSAVQVGPDKLEVVASFCNMGEMLSAGGRCEITVTTRVKTA